MVTLRLFTKAGKRRCQHVDHTNDRTRQCVKPAEFRGGFLQTPVCAKHSKVYVEYARYPIEETS